jgi:glycosyltransferase involved in cell wall biosynthesis
MLVDEEDARAVADAVGRLLENAEMSRAMGARGRVEVQDRFTWSRAADEYLQVMESPHSK